MRVWQIALYASCKRMGATEHAPRDPSHVLIRRHGLAEFVEKLMDKARPKFGDHEAFFRLIQSYCLSVRNLSCDGDVTEDEFLNASKMLEDAIRAHMRLL